MSTTNRFLGEKALVIGGSIAGLLAARILSDFFKEVLILEKDHMNEKDFTRTGVPQGAHGHALLKSGEEILNDLFPGIVDELIADGSVKSDFASELAWNHHGCWKVKYQAGMSIIQQSRPFLEWHIHRRLEMIPNINFLYGAKVKKLLISSESTSIVGVEIQNDGEAAISLKADLVVDATGARSSLSNWLRQLGFDAPQKTEVKVNLFYASRIYSSLSSINNDWGSLLVYPNPPKQTHGGGIFPIENQRWMVTLLGYGVESPPSTEEEFIKYAKSLEQADVYEAIKNGTPDTDVSVYRFPALRRFHYDKLQRFPNGLIVIGDAFCRIDPVFGQGMSIAALEAIALKKELQKALHKNKLTQISNNAHRSFSKIIDVPWLIALTEDFRFTHTDGAKPFGLPLLKWYVKRVILACESNQNVYGKLINVLQLKAHPISLFSPSTLKAVLFQVKR
ncbi:FAD-dependent monooxygenase [Bacillus sp. ISL-40]|uniref:FAD-dependent oxidoreductase n=1 Tax=unclassified Bacillus (in: firmicutes) TaxID=185979 RepID=UPI001BE7854E|nr:MULTISPECIES: FAD-dependent monooxygenase [unclassified Bacillus (in: firmicutes)]MBT2697488.1 FAD-dependent monooxygenase [Bacillus sp. ISL-40]MBT2720962.1 FAD-dependent monooxygenase [Bacillus sp. ISL-46]MBT2742193.1 FAD-dependent monooxygenase [Bacillus sp. ISL-77]